MRLHSKAFIACFELLLWKYSTLLGFHRALHEKDSMRGKIGAFILSHGSLETSCIDHYVWSETTMQAAKLFSLPLTRTFPIKSLLEEENVM